MSLPLSLSPSLFEGGRGREKEGEKREEGEGEGRKRREEEEERGGRRGGRREEERERYDAGWRRAEVNAQEVANRAGMMKELQQQAEALAGTFNAQNLANTLWAYGDDEGAGGEGGGAGGHVQSA